MLDSLHVTPSKNPLGSTQELQLAAPNGKLPLVLSPRVQRIAVVAPTVLLSTWLSSLGFPLLPRVALSLAVGVALILLVARHQRRARVS